MRRSPESGGGGSRVEAAKTPEYEFTSIEQELGLSRPYYFPPDAINEDDYDNVDVKNNPWGIKGERKLIEKLHEEAILSHNPWGLTDSKAVKMAIRQQYEQIQEHLNKLIAEGKLPKGVKKISPEVSDDPMRYLPDYDKYIREKIYAERAAREQAKKEPVAEPVAEEAVPVEKPAEEVVEEAKIESMEPVEEAEPAEQPKAPAEEEDILKKYAQPLVPAELVNPADLPQPSETATGTKAASNTEFDPAIQARLQAIAEGGYEGLIRPQEFITYYESEIAKRTEENKFLAKELSDAKTRHHYTGVNELHIPSESPAAKYQQAIDRNNSILSELRTRLASVKAAYPDLATASSTSSSEGGESSAPKSSETPKATEEAASSSAESTPKPSAPETEKTLTIEQKINNFSQEIENRRAETVDLKKRLDEEFRILAGEAGFSSPDLGSALAEGGELYGDKKTHPDAKATEAAKPSESKTEDTSASTSKKPKSTKKSESDSGTVVNGIVRGVGYKEDAKWQALSPAERGERSQRVAKTVDTYGMAIQSLLAQGKAKEAQDLFGQMLSYFDNNEICRPAKGGAYKGYPYGMDRDSLHFCQMIEYQLKSGSKGQFHIDNFGSSTRQDLPLGNHLDFMQGAMAYSEEASKLSKSQQRKLAKENMKSIRKQGHAIQSKTSVEYDAEYAEEYWQTHRFPGEFPDSKDSDVKTNAEFIARNVNGPVYTVEEAKEIRREFNGTSAEYATKILEAIYSRDMSRALRYRGGFHEFVRRTKVGGGKLHTYDYDRDIGRYVSIETELMRDAASGEKMHMKDFGKLEKRGRLPIGSGEDCARYIQDTLGSFKDYSARAAEKHHKVTKEDYVREAKLTCNRYWTEHRFPTEFLEEYSGVKERLEPLILGASATAYQHAHANAKFEDEKRNYTESGHDKHAPYISDEIDKILADNNLPDELSPEMEEYVKQMTHFDSMYSDVALGDESRRDLPVGNLSEVKQMMHGSIFNANTQYQALTKKYGLEPDYSEPSVEKDFRRAETKYQERIREDINYYWQTHRFPDEFPEEAANPETSSSSPNQSTIIIPEQFTDDKERVSAVIAQQAMHLQAALYSGDSRRANELAEKINEYLSTQIVNGRHIEEDDFSVIDKFNIGIASEKFDNAEKGIDTTRLPIGNKEARGDLPIGNNEEASKFIHDALDKLRSEHTTGEDMRLSEQVRQQANDEYWSTHRFPFEFADESAELDREIDSRLLKYYESLYRHDDTNTIRNTAKGIFDMMESNSATPSHTPADDRFYYLVSNPNIYTPQQIGQAVALRKKTDWSEFPQLPIGDESRRNLEVGNLDGFEAAIEQAREAIPDTANNDEAEKQLDAAAHEYWRTHRFPDEFPDSTE